MFLIGMCIGSFWYNLKQRLLRGEEWVVTPSHCDVCQTQLPWYHNIPLISYCLLKGRCSVCHTKIAISSVLTEIVSGCLFVLLYLKTSDFFPLMIFFLLGTLAIIDILTFDVPYFILALLLLVSLTRLQDFKFILINLSFLIPYCILASRQKMGWGDVQCYALLGLSLSVSEFNDLLFNSVMLACIAAIFVIIKRKGTLTFALPFIPFIFLSYVLYCLNITSFLEFFIKGFVKII